jgi:hypothetical protein
MARAKTPAPAPEPEAPMPEDVADMLPPDEDLGEDVPEAAEEPEVTPDADTPDDVPAPAPAPEPEALVAFVSECKGVTVWDAANDKAAAEFVDGAFATGDPRIIAILDATEGVIRK